MAKSISKRILNIYLYLINERDREYLKSDLEEIYEDILIKYGQVYANFWIFAQILKSIPSASRHRIQWSIIMLKNYVLLSFRNLRKNKVASLINIIGLSAAVGIAIVIFHLIQESYPDYSFHEKGERVFLIGHTMEWDDEKPLMGSSPVPLGPVLVSEYPQVERAVRYSRQRATVRSSGVALHETVSFADVGFFDMLTFPLQQGQATALKDPSAVIISAEMAAKYFREQDPMGQLLIFTFGNGTVKSFTVRGVAEAFPHRASMRFDFLMGYANRLASGLASLEDWGEFTDGTFIELRQPGEARYVADQLDRYVLVVNEAGESWQVTSFFLDNIRNPNFIRASQINGRVIKAPPLGEMVVFGLVGLLVLLISCFNYITISLGSAARRLKEIGVRKTVGAEKRQLVLQFLTENLLLCFLALLGGLIFARMVVLPFLYSLSPLQPRIDFTSNLDLLLFLFGLLAFIGLVSGTYPALYISSFRPAAILRGKRKLAEKKGLTRTLTTVQFIFTLITICISIFIASLDDKLTGGDWGYRAEHTLVIPSLSQEQYTRLRNEALQLSGISQVAGAEHHIGSSYDGIFMQVEGAEILALFFGVGPTYLDVMGLRLETGRAFDEAFSAAVVINQTFAQQQGWTDPIGKGLRIGDKAFSVIGVVEDFLLDPFEGKAQPVVFGISDEARHNFLTVQVEDGVTDQVVAALRTIWERQFPEVPFWYFPQTEVFQEFNSDINISLQLCRNLGLFALFISCMGIFGMASQKAVQRIKEVGIRKVMGASAAHVVFLVNRSFLVMLGIASLIASPLCYVGLRIAVSYAPIEIPLGVTPFILSNLLVFFVAAVSLSMQTNTLVKVNPAEVLRNE